MAVVYIHSKPDGEIFYVGISNNTARPYSKTRSEWWTSVVAKYGYTVSIIMDNITYEQAKVAEIVLIAMLGRRDRGRGTLVNMTDGGEGSLGNRIGSIIRQYTLDGEYIAEYNSAREAIRVTGITGISRAVNPLDKRKTAGGFVWKQFKETKI